MKNVRDISNGANASGNTRMSGDLEGYASKSKDIFYGLVEDDWGDVFCVDEVTIKPSY
jgi:hypothetical protein